MTFTYDPNIGNDISFVRFHVGDTSSDGYYLQDEEINFFVVGQGREKAVLRCISFIITQLSIPTFKKDWLEVSAADAIKAFESLLTRKSVEFGIPISKVKAASVIIHPKRSDSNQTDNVY